MCGLIRPVSGCRTSDKGHYVDQDRPFIRTINERAIDSALQQDTDFPVEIVIGEDGSTDGTREICVRYAEQHPNRIRLFLRGRAVSILREGTRDRVLNGHFTRLAARGTYVAPLEGDDAWLGCDKLARQAACLDADPRLAACFTNAQISDVAHPARQRLQYRDARRKTRAVEPVPLSTDTVGTGELLLQHRIMIMAWMIRRAVLLAFPAWYDDIPFTDRAIAVLAAAAGHVRYLPEITAVYTKHAGGMWTGCADIEAKYETSIEIFKRIGDHLGPAYDPIIQPVVARLYLTIARYHAKHANEKRAASSPRKATLC